MIVSQTNLARLAAMGTKHRWEVHHGELREKPTMTYRHNHVTDDLGFLLRLQLDTTRFEVRTSGGRVRRGDVTYYIPDLIVIPTALIGPEVDQPDILEIYSDPLPLVVEVWSPSTAIYDINEKIPEYQRRGDRETWRLHPYDRTLTAWRRQPDGAHVETVFHGGTVQPVALPEVSIDLDALFA